MLVAEIVGKDKVLAANTDRITHSYDATQQKHLPEVVVYAHPTEKIQRVVQLTNQENIAITHPVVGIGHNQGRD